MLRLALLALLILSSVLRAQEPVTIRVERAPDPASTSMFNRVNREVIHHFLKKNPDIRIERFAMPTIDGAWNILMAIAAGQAPEAIYINFRISSTYVQRGYLEPLEELLARVQSSDPEVRKADSSGRWIKDPPADEIAAALEQIRQRVPDRIWPVVYRRDESGQSTETHVWAMPRDMVVMALLYRKDLFQLAGLDPDRPPQTWDELLEYTRRLTVPERRQYGIGLSGGSSIAWAAYTFIVSNGGRAVESDENGVWRACYASRASAEAAYFLWQLARQPYEREGRRQVGSAYIESITLVRQMFERGRTAMHFEYLDQELIGNINPQLIGFAPVPIAPSGSRGSELNSAMYGVFAGASPEKKLAAMRFIMFYTSEEAQKIRTDYYVDNGVGAFVSPDLLKKFGYERILSQVPPKWREVFEAALAGGVPEPYGRNTQNIYQYLTEPLFTAMEMDLQGVPKEVAVKQIENVLQESQEKTNQRLLGIIPADEMLKRRILAFGVILLAGGAFVAGGIWLWRSFSRNAPTTSEVMPRRLRMIAWLLLAPPILFVLIWDYLPLAGGLGMAFTDYQLVIKSTFVGVDNFATVLYDPDFWWSLWRTLFYVALILTLGFWPPILLAILLDEVPTTGAKYLFRTLFYLPAVISGVIVMFLWKQLYEPSPFGVLNQLLLSLNNLDPISATLIKLIAVGMWSSLVGLLIWLPVKLDEMSKPMKLLLWTVAAIIIGVTIAPFITGETPPSALVGKFNLEALRWIDSPDAAMFCVVLPLVWAHAGPGCILYLAALKTVPSDLYEAADVDGAGLWHKVAYIMLPQIKYLIGIQLLAAVIGAFKGGADYILAMTAGGPNGATNVLALEILRRSFIDLQFGVGTAMAWLLGAMLIFFTAYQLRLLSRAEFTAGGKTKGAQ